jgi:LPXTG-site transpeptidase (sortase) family protein
LGWLQVRICLCAFALLLAVPPLGADTVPGGFRQAPQIPVWIQDPWTGDTVLAQYGEPDKSLWNGARVDDYREALAQDGAPALGILTIEKLNIQVPIYNGTDEYNLNRGVGRIKGMAKLRDDSGNLGLSGHRDGFFRGLKDMQVGDEIEVQTPQGVDRYGVDSITIVPKRSSPATPSTSSATPRSATSCGPRPGRPQFLIGSGVCRHLDQGEVPRHSGRQRSG